MAFLRVTGVLPEDHGPLHRAKAPTTDRNPAAIPGIYLAEFAAEWDSMGPSQPGDFITALAFECRGTPEHSVVAEMQAQEEAAA